MMSAMLALLVVGSPANNVTVHAKKHTECFNSVVSDGKDHPFDAARFDRCDKNYQDGFLKGCKDAGIAQKHANRLKTTKIDPIFLYQNSPRSSDMLLRLKLLLVRCVPTLYDSEL